MRIQYSIEGVLLAASEGATAKIWMLEVCSRALSNPLNPLQLFNLNPFQKVAAFIYLKIKENSKHKIIEFSYVFEFLKNISDNLTRYCENPRKMPKSSSETIKSYSDENWTKHKYFM